ncbi:hypothetical protein [uncultured Enterococcus sp.]|jgi:DNA polymerase-3 subunit epsilon|uniref:hypothetical protein n=1 Tax=Enterococcus sp. DIV1297f TaxID=2774691 RepID=UPI002587F220|nr:hypothetical protein [uncultured Enterococcus sp.]
MLISKELRKELNLPLTKDIVYYRRIIGREYDRLNVVAIEKLTQYKPSGSFSLRITLSGSLMNESEQVNILSDFLAQMQKPTFINDANDIDYELYNTKW